VGPTTIFKAGDRPFPRRPAGVDTLPKIRHIVVVMMENHSFDNYFGMLGRGDGFTLDAAGKPTDSNPGPDGQAVVVFPSPSVCQSDVDISQDWVVSHTSWNHGKNDGFALAKGTTPMGYYGAADLPSTTRSGAPSRSATGGSARRCPDRPEPPLPDGRSSFGLVDDSSRGCNHVVSPRRLRHGLRTAEPLSIPWKNYYSNLPSSLLFPYLGSKYADNIVPIATYSPTLLPAPSPPSAWWTELHQLVRGESQDIQNGEQFAASVINAPWRGPGGPRPC